MIITRTPLRISLGGGGTDLPSYYRQASGGFLIAAAISKYVFIAINRNFDDSILLKYSNIERVVRPGEAEHPLFRETLLFTGVEDPVEISAMADIPAGTGLGSSGAFTVGLLRALHSHKREIVSSEQLAREACHIEIGRLREPIGKQDQYIAAIGGITGFEFRPDDGVDIVPVCMPNSTRDRIEDNLLLFYTGLKRSASEILAVDVGPSPAIDLETNLDAVKALGRETQAALETGDLDRFGKLLTEQWRLKLERSPSAEHRAFDELIGEGVDAGAGGGKLVGAGGGGFLLFYAEEKAALRHVMAGQGLEEVRFGIDYEGSTTIVAQ